MKKHTHTHTIEGSQIKYRRTNNSWKFAASSDVVLLIYELKTYPA